MSIKYSNELFIDRIENSYISKYQHVRAITLFEVKEC